MTEHLKHMKRALALAKRGLGKTSPNPAVGCVIVRDGRTVGEGWHRKAGEAHAEVHALAMAGDAASGADVYVTLEPCSHHGRTPPCADALVAAGVKRVFAAMVDPNPKVAGRGLEILGRAGIEVETGLLETESRMLNRPFIKHVTTRLPYVTLKSAMTMDGKTAAATGDSRWITSDSSRLLVHRLRAQSDAIMVGVGTVRADDPLLTCRIRGGRNPLRVIVDSSLSIPLHSRVLDPAHAAGTIIATLSAETPKGDRIREQGARLLPCREAGGRVDLHDLLARLGAMGVQSVLLEGGNTLGGEALRQGLVDRFLFFHAPKLIGGDAPGLFSGDGAAVMADAVPLRTGSIRRIGGDLLIEAFPEGTCLPVS